MNKTLISAKERIAQRVAQELQNGDLVNLGIGLPTLIPSYISNNIQVTLQSENGFIGLSSVDGNSNPDLVNAGGQPAGIKQGGAFFDSAFSFELIRGGHVDVTVLGGLEVDQEGNLANWIIPGKLVPGMGGAMDLVTGAKKVIIAMEHLSKKGEPKIVKKCKLPLTGSNVVDMIVTELAVFKIENKELTLIELMPGVGVDEVRDKTEADFNIHEDIKTKIN